MSVTNLGLFFLTKPTTLLPFRGELSTSQQSSTMSQLTNLEEFTLQIFLKQLELSPRMPAEALVTSSASLASKLLDAIGSTQMVQTPEETAQEETEPANDGEGTPFDESPPAFPEL